MSQIVKGSKELTIDQAVLIAEFVGLTELETRYFVLLVHHLRAGNQSSRSFFRKQLDEIKERALSLSERLSSEAILTEEQRATFYSDWAYSAVRQSIAIDGLTTAMEISKFLGLPLDRSKAITDFLVRSGLVKLSNGGLKIGPSSTHLESSSPWVKVHYSNWRQKAIQSLDHSKRNDLHYTSPLTISRDDAVRINELIIQLIQKVHAVVDPSPSENLYCLNLDWFKVGVDAEPY